MLEDIPIMGNPNSEHVSCELAEMLQNVAKGKGFPKRGRYNTPKENIMYNILLEFNDNDGQREYIIENATEYYIEEWDNFNEIKIKTKLGECFKLPFTSGKVSVREVGTDRVEVENYA